MLCNNCEKLAYAETKKKCLKCASNVLKSIGLICIECSLKNNICEICLKKLITKDKIVGLRPFFNSKCKSCGG